MMIPIAFVSQLFKVNSYFIWLFIRIATPPPFLFLILYSQLYPLIFNKSFAWNSLHLISLSKIISLFVSFEIKFNKLSILPLIELQFTCVIVKELSFLWFFVLFEIFTWLLFGFVVMIDSLIVLLILFMMVLLEVWRAWLNERVVFFFLHWNI